ncbi:hypothetical protein [Caballeronia novacaledonica]|uniref:Uncharacterized protein n=1 Tax=Caballeronia novacaledonica TaxID=1544861 RepID=A0AA37I755_9BURK|nr:hypothetical protein [Caballeronia novacaledonica]GJH23809.1 hypothetical protein CBA19CS42_04855 [Caballeronia novacaledonica]
MQHAQNQAANETSNNAIVYVIDQGGGWEQDEDVVWIIEEGNEAEWENQ